ncbi:hypothetical protein [Nonomuraea sp. NPDC049758]|uniref:hypothetical protein n=1 Tax=Nonomuraea sp. NPDC049758 TaxID=3154360 RepID=UPI0034459142
MIESTRVLGMSTLFTFLLAAAGEPPLPIAGASVAVMALLTSAFTKRVESWPSPPPVPTEIAYEAGLRDGHRSAQRQR